jgi:hypothetical protein
MIREPDPTGFRMRSNCTCGSHTLEIATRCGKTHSANLEPSSGTRIFLNIALLSKILIILYYKTPNNHIYFIVVFITPNYGYTSIADACNKKPRGIY